MSAGPPPISRLVDVPSWHIFAAKILSVIVGANLVGLGILVARRRSAATSRLRAAA